MTIEAPPQHAAVAGPFVYFMDLIRGVAAQLVVVGHSGNVFLPSIFMLVTPAGLFEGRPDVIMLQNLAVLIFFYVSGYLITSTFLKKSKNPDWRLRDFLADRAARIFTPLVPLLLILFVTDKLVFGTYATTPYTTIDASFANLCRNILMLFDNPVLAKLERLTGLHGLAGPAFGSAEQLWSVVVEWWIYVLFGVLAFWLIHRRGPLALWLALLALAIPVPLAASLRISGLGIAWVVGMGMCLATPRLRTLGWPLLLGLGALALLGATVRWLFTRFNFYDPITAAALGIGLFLLMEAVQRRGFKARPAHRLVLGMSKISYSLYLVHLSIIFYAAHYFPALVGNWLSILLAILLCNLGATLFYLAFERHYPRVRQLMEPWLRRWPRLQSRGV